MDPFSAGQNEKITTYVGKDTENFTHSENVSFLDISSEVRGSFMRDITAEKPVHRRDMMKRAVLMLTSSNRSCCVGTSPSRGRFTQLAVCSIHIGWEGTDNKIKSRSQATGQRRE